MNRVKCIWNDIVNNFFSKRLVVFCIFQFSILHYYISTVKHFSIIADYPAAPWILPFIGQNVYCLFVYGISVVYFYSNIPFMQKHEMYVLMRQGRSQWVFTKTLRICLSAIMLSIIEFVLSIYINRTTAVVAGTFFSVLPVVFANLYLSKEWIGFISPLSWLNLLLLYGKICKKSPSFSQIIIVTAVLLPVLSVVSLKGMRQRLAVAQAIMEDPDFLILDEPFNGLDNQGVVEMRNIFLEFKQEGKVIIVASHNSEDIKVLCDHVHSMEAGNLKIIR